MQATEHQIKALGDSKQTRAVGNDEPDVETVVPEWLQPFTTGLHRRSSNSTDVSPGDVETPPPVLPPSVHPPAKPSSNRAGGKHNFFHSFSERPELRSVRTHESYEGAVQKTY